MRTGVQAVPPAYWIGDVVNLLLPLLLRALQPQHIQPLFLLICQLQLYT